ncbi:hypothetical protein J5289_28295 (plasmid) [Rhizobium sp. B230/85]|nr:hypothetical protein [Rhizobium sp. B209b/85]QXZ99731.1 hypothetical protein J5289_28295 [Rhizobium sp. B230/85]
MARRPRRNQSPAFKSGVAIAAIPSEQTLVELSSSLRSTPTGLTVEEQLLEETIGVFGDETEAGPAGPTVDDKTLHAKISELKLKKVFLA